MLEEYRPQDGNLTQHGQREGLKSLGLDAHKGRAQIVRQPHPENGQGQARHGLIPLKDQAHHAVQQPYAARAQPGGQGGQPGVARMQLHDKGEKSPQNHHAFHPEVDDPRAFGDDFAQRGVQQGRARQHRGGQQRQDQVPVHASSLRGRGALSAARRSSL